MDNGTAFVTDISWERIWLHLTVNVQSAVSDPEFYLVDESGSAGAFFEVEKRKDDTFLLSVNITNNGTRSCIPGGRYRLIMYTDDREMTECEISPDLADRKSVV